MKKQFLILSGAFLLFCIVTVKASAFSRNHFDANYLNASVLMMPINMDECLLNPILYWDQEEDKCISQIIPCVDPDGGKNYEEQAHTFGWRSWNLKESERRIRTGGKDACVNGKLREHYCLNDNIVFEDIECPNGCKNGECQSGSGSSIPNDDETICKDSDGEDFFTKGTYVIIKSDGSKQSDSDGCYSNGDLYEYVCDPVYGDVDVVRYTCPFGCNDGKCNKYGCDKNGLCKAPSYSSSSSSIKCAMNGEEIFPSNLDGNRPTICCSENAGHKSISKFVNGMCLQSLGGAVAICIENWSSTCGDGECSDEEDKCTCPKDCNENSYSSFSSSYSVPDLNIPPAGFEDEVIVNMTEYKNPFPDTNMDELSGRAAAELYRRAVLGGFPDGQFKGERPVNRAEAAKFLLLTKLKNIDEHMNNGRFPDVMEGQWYTKFVIKAANMGIINGHPGGHFKPADPVNTAEFLKMIANTFNLSVDLPYSYSDVSSTDWFAPYTGIAQKYNLFSHRTSKLEPSRALTREEVAVAIYQFLQHR